MPAKSEREYRSMTMAAETRAEGEQETMTVTGYATTFDDPYLLYKDDEVEVWEEVDRGAFRDTDMTDTIMQYDHQGRVFARVRNKTLQVEPDDTGLHITADLSGTEIGRNLYQEIAGGYTDQMSFGFTVAEDSREITEDRETGRTVSRRRILRVGKLFDVSAVSLPANPGTVISARCLDGLIQEARTERSKAQETAERRKAITERVNTILAKE